MVSRPDPLGRGDFKAWWSFATHWADNDLYGHVNNIVYYQWFDSAVNGWRIDRQLLDIDSGQIVGLVVETSCSYFEPLAFPRPVEVGIALAHLGTSSVRYRMGVFDVGSRGPRPTASLPTSTSIALPAARSLCPPCGARRLPF